MTGERPPRQYKAQEVPVTAVPPFKESSRELIAEVARALEPYFPDITNKWREQLTKEFGFDGRTLAAVERLTLAAGCSYFCHMINRGSREIYSTLARGFPSCRWTHALWRGRWNFINPAANLILPACSPSAKPKPKPRW